MNAINILSFNVRGLGDHQKRKDVLQWLRQQKADILCLQDIHCASGDESRWLQLSWGYKCYIAPYTSNSRGVAILFNNSFEYKVNGILADPLGNYLILDITTNDLQFTLVNIYGPNNDNPEFFDNIKTKIQSVEQVSTIICGDWNVVQDYALDTKGYLNRNNVNAQKEIKSNLIPDLDLEDVWRIMHPKDNRFTWRQKTPIKQSRLDYFLVSSDIAALTSNTDILPGYRSDHSLVTLTIEISNEIKGRGVWKFNNSLLYDNELINKIKNKIQDTINEYKVKDDKNINIDNTQDVKLTINDQLFLEVLKLNIRSVIIPYTSYKKQQLIKSEKELEQKLNAAEIRLNENSNDDALNEVDRLQEELRVMRQNKIQGAIIRSRANWYEYSDRASKYFCSLEKRNYVTKTINKLVTEPQNKSVTKQSEILDESKKFYEKLYKKKK